jgi:DNA-binding CsgD family transcriptional regulator
MMAEIVGADSPTQMIGKTDHDFVWRPHVTLYHSDDADVMRGNPMMNVLRPQTQFSRVAVMLNTKLILTDKNGDPNGVCGHCVDVTGYSVTKNSGHIDPQKNIFFLGEKFGNEYLTKRELAVFRYLLLGKSAEEIARIFDRSIKTVQAQVKHIANKLKCSHKSEIVPTAIKFGLTYVLDKIELTKN